MRQLLTLSTAVLLTWLAGCQNGSSRPGGASTATTTDPKTAIAIIQSVGGTIEVDEKMQGKPVVKVNLGESRATDATLAQLRALPRLQKLVLRKTKVGDAGLANLESLT